MKADKEKKNGERWINSTVEVRKSHYKEVDKSRKGNKNAKGSKRSQIY
jgi:hypothetical protein